MNRINIKVIIFLEFLRHRDYVLATRLPYSIGKKVLMSVTVKTNLESLVDSTGIPDVISEVVCYLIDLIRNCSGECQLQRDIVVSVTHEDIILYLVESNEPIFVDLFDSLKQFVTIDMDLKAQYNRVKHEGKPTMFGHYIVNVPFKGDLFDHVNIHVIRDGIIDPDLLNDMCLGQIYMLNRFLNKCNVTYSGKYMSFTE